MLKLISLFLLAYSNAGLKLTMDAAVPESCANCGEQAEKLLRCTRCKGVRYCGRECQKAHWSQHKQHCLAPKIATRCQECDHQCVICLESLTNPVTTTCEHTFCQDCLTGHFNANGRNCPICRADVPVPPVNIALREKLETADEKRARLEKEEIEREKARVADERLKTALASGFKRHREGGLFRTADRATQTEQPKPPITDGVRSVVVVGPITRELPDSDEERTNRCSLCTIS